MKYRIAIGCFLFFQAIWAQNPISIDSITTYAGRNYYTHPDSAQYYLHKGIALAEAQGDFYKKGIFLNKLITQKTRIRDYDSARYYFKYTKTYLEQNQLETLFPDVHSEIAETYFYMERLDSALYHFKISDTLYHRLGDSIGVLIAKNNMANVYQIQGNYKEAIVNMLEAAKNVDTTQYLYIKVEMYHNIAQLYRQVHEPAKASQFATRSLELALQNPNYPQDLVTSYGIMAQLATDRSDFGQAAHYIDLAKQTIQVRGLDIVNYKVLGSEASLLVAQGAFEKAIPFIQDALTVGAEQGLSDFEIFSLKKDLALCFFKLNRLQEAQNLLLELLDSAQKMEGSKTWPFCTNSFPKYMNCKAILWRPFQISKNTTSTRIACWVCRNKKASMMPLCVMKPFSRKRPCWKPVPTWPKRSWRWSAKTCSSTAVWDCCWCWD